MRLGELTAEIWFLSRELSEKHTQLDAARTNISEWRHAMCWLDSSVKIYLGSFRRDNNVPGLYVSSLQTVQGSYLERYYSLP